MIYKVHVVFTPFQELRYTFGCYKDLLEFLDTLSVRDDLSQMYISKVKPDWYNMTESF